MFVRFVRKTCVIFMMSRKEKLLIPLTNELRHIAGALFVCKGISKMSKVVRPDRDGTHRGAFEKNRKRIFATQTVCGICGKPVDFRFKYPHPLSASIDHIIPIARGGHPSDIDNLQLAHWTCNRQKSDKLIASRGTAKSNETEVLSNRILPQSQDWANYRG